MTASSKDIFGENQNKLNPNEDLSVLDSKEKRENAINSLNQIKSRINEENVAIDDLQFFIGDDGSFYVSDPLNIYVEQDVGVVKGLTSKKLDGIITNSNETIDEIQNEILKYGND